MVKKTKSTLIIFFVIIIHIISAVPASAAYIDGSSITSQGVCVMDFETGEILYEHNGNIPRSPASMTKIMSLYCIYSELERQGISIDTIVPISGNVYSLPVRTNYQCITLYNNVPYTVDELIGAVATYSASNALLALVELVSGSEAEFVKLMNITAQQMGIDAYYYDSCGGYTNKVTPIAMATLARNIMKDYPDIINRTSKKSINFHGGTYYSTNKLYTTYYYEGADGLKTGTSSSAGHCFCGTAVRGDNRVISVAMLAPSNDGRFGDTVKLLNYGFEVLEDRKAYLYYTDLCTYIDGSEMPTFMRREGVGSANIIVEDLAAYGFDVTYDHEQRLLTAIHNPRKTITPIPLQIYKGKNLNKAYRIYDLDTLRVIIKSGDKEYEANTVCNLGGYASIAVDELAQMFEYKWDVNTKSGYIKTR